MDSAFQPEAWHDLYMLAGTAAAGLTGLIFVAVSLHLREVTRDPWHRGSAGSSLLGLMSIVLISGAVLAPAQSVVLLGTEIAVIALASPAYSVLALAHLPRAKRRAALVEIVVGLAGGVLAVAAGVSLVLGVGGGLWLLLPGIAIALGTSVLNAWRLIVDVVGARVEDGP